MNNKARLFKIDRLRLETDGSGVRSLVCFCDCPLDCKYCLNKKQMRTPLYILTPEALRDSLMIDDLYFKASSVGGVTFGGGEPAIHSEYIEEFRELCPPEWTIFMETSLNVSAEHVKRLTKIIDHWFIDIKDTNNGIYDKYTGTTNVKVLNNIKYLIEEGLADRITVRVPLIPGYNTQADVDKSVSMLREMGIKSIDNLTYFIDNTPERPPLMGVPSQPLTPISRPYLIIAALLVGFCLGVVGALLIPSKVMSIIGGILIGLIVFLILCIIILLPVQSKHSLNDD